MVTSKTANKNIFLKFAKKIQRFNDNVWVKLVNKIREATPIYKTANETVRQRIVKEIYADIERYQKEIIGICHGQEQEQVIFELENKNKTRLADKLKNFLEGLMGDFSAHFPANREEIARRLKNSRFFQQGRNFWATGLNINEAIRLLKRLAEIEQEGSDKTGEITKESEYVLTGEAKALAILVEHPEWTDTKIAEEVGVNRTTLYDWPKFKKAKEALKQGKNKFPSGSKNGNTGDIEAWDEKD